MGSNPTIKVGITANAGQAVASIKEVQAAEERLTQATKALADAQKQFSYVSASNADAQAQANAVLAEYQAEVNAAQASLRDLIAAQGAATDSTDGMTAARTRNTEALAANTMARRQAYDATYAFTGSTFGAARAISDFTTKFPILQGAIAAAFDVAIVFAFAEMAYRAGKAIYDAFEKGWEAELKFQQNLSSVNDSFDVLIARTEVETDKLNAANAKLEHKPAPNAMKEAIDQALLAAAALDSKLDMVLSKEQTLLQSQVLNPSWESQIFTGFGGTKQEQLMLQQHQLNLSTAPNIQAQLSESESYGKALQSRMAALKSKIAQDNQDIQNSTATGDSMYAIGAARDIAAKERQVKAIELLISFQKKEQAAIQDTIALGKAQKEHDILTAPLKGHEARHAALHQSLAVSLMFSEAMDAARGRTAALRSEHSTLLANQTNDANSYYNGIFEKSRMEQKLQQEAAQAYREKAAALAQGVQATQSQAEYQNRVSTTGLIGSPTQIDEAKAAADSRMYATELAAIQNELSQLVPYTQEYEKAQQKLNQTMQKAKLTQLQDAFKVSGDVAAPFVNSINTVNQAWLGMQDKLIFGTRFIGRQFQNMGVQMLEAVASGFERMLMKQLEFEIRSRVLHEITNRMKLQSDAQTSAEGLVISRQNALQEVFMEAKKAAAGTFAAVMTHVPFPLDLALAPVAAGAAFAGVMALGAFETGGVVPQTGLYLMHEQEAVLPKNLTTMLTSVANNSTSYSGGTTVNHSATFNGFTDRSFRDMARRNSEAIVGAVHSSLRGRYAH